ncbi:hypothetical protein BT96DRAFT_1006560 [Gymnopus androsaceus JB14]|uniref:Uncharacterized protein n=1 Tax=Gymnopus androsaceus JB14 TaxID=1447944 RepID=A0A6A4GKR2_9AGAR|nr:hypothetical protein BT96DRAFT_1006560 [Gymnopus androsaceus JB14]
MSNLLTSSFGDEAQPPSGLPPTMRGPVPPEDLPDSGYCTSEDFIVYGNDASDAQRNEQMGIPVPHGGGTHHLRKGVDITMALEYIALACRVQAFNDSGAVKKPVNQRNDVDRTAIANFSQPRFVEFAYSQSAKKDKGKGRKHTKKAKPSTGADQDPSSSATTRLEGLKAPTQSDPPEYWAQYHYSYPDNTGGIRRDSNNHVSVRSIRGCLLITGRAPRMPRGTPATERNHFLFLSTELFATPGLYASLIGSTGLTVTSVTYQNVPT